VSGFHWAVDDLIQLTASVPAPRRSSRTRAVPAPTASSSAWTRDSAMPPRVTSTIPCRTRRTMPACA
jgi:hypothetical protein